MPVIRNVGETSVCHCGCGQQVSIDDRPNTYEKICAELNTTFSVLSPGALTYIIIRVNNAMMEGYRQGFHEGYRKASIEAAEDAAGEDI